MNEWLVITTLGTPDSREEHWFDSEPAARAFMEDCRGDSKIGMCYLLECHDRWSGK